MIADTDDIVIRDPVSRETVSGKIVKQYANCVTVDDKIGVRRTVDNKYIVSVRKTG